MRVVGVFTVAGSHPSLPGHFPGRPVVPGVVLLDEAAALILAAHPGLRLAGFPAVRFTRPVLPGAAVSVVYAAGRFIGMVGQDKVFEGRVALVETGAAAPPP